MYTNVIYVYKYMGIYTTWVWRLRISPVTIGADTKMISMGIRLPEINGRS